MRQAHISLTLVALAWLYATPATAGPPPPAVEAAAAMLHGWDVVGAEQALAAHEAQAELGGLGIFVKAQMRFYQGDYAAAAQLLDSLPPAAEDGSPLARLRAEVEAARTETQGYQEIQADDGRILIRHKAGPDAVLVPIISELLPKIREGMARHFDFVPDHPVLVEIYPESEALARVTFLKASEIENSGTIAITKYNRLMITSPGSLVRGYRWIRTLAHEYIHLVVTKISKNTVPIWLHEGIAKYFEGQWEPTHRPDLEPGEESLLAVALRDKQLITFEEMSPSMAKLPTQKHASLAFAEVHTVIQFLQQRAGTAAVGRVLRSLGAGQAEDEKAAIEQVTGLSFPRFEAAWKRWLKKQSYRIRKDAGIVTMRFKKSNRADDREELEGLSKEVHDFVRLGDLLRGRGRHLAGLQEYNKALAKVAGQQDPVVRCRIASSHLALDEPKKAIEAVKKLPEIHPDHSMAYILLGDSHVRLKQDTNAYRWLSMALRFNPYDPMIHAGLVQACKSLARPACTDRARQALELLRSQGNEPSSTGARDAPPPGDMQ